MSSAQTNSQLPIACSDVNNSASVDQPRSRVHITSTSCSPLQSGSGHAASRGDGGETAVKFAAGTNASISLHSDVAAAATVHGSRSSEPQLPYCVSNVGNAGESLIDLRSDFDAGGRRRRNVNGSRLSRDGVFGPMTDVDANLDEDQTFTQTGSTSA